MPKRLVVAVFAVVAVVTACSIALASDDIIKAKRDVLISKDMVVNDVVVIHGSVTSYGKAEGSIVAVGGSVYLKENASVGGDVVAVGGQIVMDPSVSIKGKTTQINMPHFIPSMATLLTGGWIAVWAAVSIAVLLGFLGLAVLLIALIPEHIGSVVRSLESSFVKMLFWGLLSVMLIVPVAALLAVSIVGLVLIPLEILLVALALIIGYIAAALYIGKSIFQSMKRTPPPFVDAILGIVVLFIVGFVPILGALIKAILVIAGFGAVVITRFGTNKS